LARPSEDHRRDGSGDGSRYKLQDTNHQGPIPWGSIGEAVPVIAPITSMKHFTIIY
jgi:hypothetical protein